MHRVIEKGPLNRVTAVRFDSDTYQQLLDLAPKRRLGETIRLAVKQYLSKKTETSTDVRCDGCSLVSDKQISLEAQKKNSAAVC